VVGPGGGGDKRGGKKKKRKKKQKGNVRIAKRIKMFKIESP